MSGQFDCYRFNLATDELLEKWTYGPGDVIYVPSMELNGMINLSKIEQATFLCCIYNIYEAEPV